MCQFSDADLQAFLDELLPAEQMSVIEQRLREDAPLHERLSDLRGQQDAGLHSIGAIWRRHRLSCATREQLGQYLLGVLDDEQCQYLDFHIHRVGCRFCQSNLQDLQRQQQDSGNAVEQRRQRFFQTSVGHLHPKS